MTSRLRRRPRRWSHWTLRSRLVLVVGALAAVALIAANVAGLLLIRSYLRDRIDEQLTGMARPFAGTQRPEPAPRPRQFRLGADQVVYVYGPDGTLDPARSSAVDGTRPAAEAITDVRARAAQGKPYTVAAVDGSADWRLLAVPAPNTGGVVVIGSSLMEVEQTGDRLLIIDVGVTVLMLALLGLGSAFVVRLGLRPLTEMERLATDISAGNLSGRVADTDPHTEPGRLGGALNLMLARIEAEVSARTASEQRLRQFVADASHELRTPLTSIRGFAELYRRGGAPPGPQLDETMSRIEGEAGRMGVLVEDLLLLARLDLKRPPVLRPVDLLEIAADTIRDAHARVPDRPVRLAALDDTSDTFVPPTVLGDEHGLRQVATNLVANALQHTTGGARVTVRVGRVAGYVPAAGAVRSGNVAAGVPLAVLEVSDDGPGVPADHAPRVFERLYRADSSRMRGRGGGSGLGLSIVAAIVHGHGGWVELDPAGAGGATFRVLLPASGDDTA
ncbi:putative two-component system sensor kinase [Actinoplanes friuliensis DSM 7358]|uniref:histidine kinase n=1 Tax=Actinoplanes friuliensis DSM 7358 TaxID=1246995 RepID=U5W374_9ACTN|nr:HAMP domain-containing sensor histidine kinase [Actinoplanes friuliensis]AGZ42386.1 putative two-component system sensor kinase [Actinoplanes friuliensis DSM 7358]